MTGREWLEKQGHFVYNLREVGCLGDYGLKNTASCCGKSAYECDECWDTALNNEMEG